MPISSQFFLRNETVLNMCNIYTKMINLLFQILLATSLFSSGFSFEFFNTIRRVGDIPDSVSVKDAFLTVPELIVKYGYPLEVHHIITEDGYILTAHRIPYGRHCRNSTKQRVVWMQHGLAASSADWIITGPERDLGYYLADNCYDVWLGNSRGNRYSKRHLHLDPSRDKKFWEFSFNELGIYDLPASFDYVLNVTGANSLYYVGHSMGTAALFVCLSERPEYNAKIKLMSALAPTAYLKHMISPVFRFFANFGDRFEQVLGMVGINDISASPQTGQLLGQTICHQNMTTRRICEGLLYETTGFDPDQMDRNTLAAAFGHYPSGNSVRTFTHLFQVINSGGFHKFNFGRDTNLRVYGRPEPPEYNLDNIVAPVALYFGENDLLCVEPDVMRLAKRLPNTQRVYRIKHKKYAHHDFLLAKDNPVLLNKPVLKFMKEF